MKKSSGPIREEIELMGLSELSFAPVVTIVDPGRFGTEAKKIPRFIENQVKEAKILCINKTDIAPAKIVLATEQMLTELNPEAKILKISAKLGDEQFENLLIHLAVPGIGKPPQKIRDRVKEINPDFIGHIKLSLKLPDYTIKGSVTSS